MADISAGIFELLAQIFSTFLSAMVSLATGFLSVVTGIPNGEFFDSPVTLAFIFAACIGIWYWSRRYVSS